MNDSKPSLKSKPKPANLSWKGKLILVAASVLFTCAVMEVGLRVAAAIDQRRAKAISPEFWAIYDPDLGYRGNSKYVDIL